MKTLFAEFVDTTLLPNDAAILRTFKREDHFRDCLVTYMQTKFPASTVRKGGAVRDERSLMIPDITMFNSDTLQCALELKLPLSGAVPDTLFRTCEAISKTERYLLAGFQSAATIIMTDDHLFREGRLTGGIYEAWRSYGTVPLTGTVRPGTVTHDYDVPIIGSYHIEWKLIVGNWHYAIVEAKL